MTEIQAKNLTFSKALDLLKQGHLLTRPDWNGSKAGLTMYLVKEPGGFKTINPGRGGQLEVDMDASLVLWVNGKGSPYLPTNVDLFAKDWEIA